MNGFLCIDKPKGPSSFDIIRTVRQAAGIKKIGHNGTLDPEATGLLILALGKATRLLPYLKSEPKTYEFTVQFGRTTDTLDSAGSVTEEGKPLPSEEALVRAAGSFQGRISQKPPLHSAVKIKGKPAYKLARQNKVFDIPEREVEIHSLRLLGYNKEKGEASFMVVCSRGTYIRSLARDIAEKADTLGYASSIRRVAAGEFSVQKAVTPDAVQEGFEKHIMAINSVFASFPSHTASPLQIKKLSHGNEIEVENSDSCPVLFVYSPEKELLAVAENRSPSTYHPVKVFI